MVTVQNTTTPACALKPLWNCHLSVLPCDLQGFGVTALSRVENSSHASPLEKAAKERIATVRRPRPTHTKQYILVFAWWQDASVVMIRRKNLMSLRGGGPCQVASNRLVCVRKRELTHSLCRFQVNDYICQFSVTVSWPAAGTYSKLSDAQALAGNCLASLMHIPAYCVGFEVNQSTFEVADLRSCT